MDLETAQTTITTKFPILKQGPITTEEKVQKKNDVKARSMLLMALSNEHLTTFNQYKDAQTLFVALQTRFGGFRRLGKGTASLSSSSQNMAFVSSPSSTNEVNTAYRVSTANNTLSYAAGLKLALLVLNVKESPDAPLVKELVLDDKLEKKIVFPTVAKIECIRPKQQEKLVRKPVNVLFTDTGCFVLSPDFKLADESHVLLKVPRKNNMYSVDIKNIIPKESLTCLVAKTTLDESML
ncbi:hypothetical protein Tco_0128029 [Tanacetum coccineum]